jgi:xanthine dehydrogenase molybdopterin-binding subunit B
MCELCREEKANKKKKKNNPYKERGDRIRSYGFTVDDLLYLERIVDDLKTQREYEVEREYDAVQNRKSAEQKEYERKTYYSGWSSL